jgi:protein-S-isoprenylcysteine O-methyltransferase Ste14
MLSRIYPVAVGVWALAVIIFAKPLGPRSAVGGALALGGVALAAWTAGYDRASALAPGDEDGGSLFAGPYGWLRNPSRLGTTLVALGLAIWSGALWPWLPLATAVLLASYFTVMQRAADKEAEQRLGWVYRTYRATVPVWLPRFTPRPWLAEGRWRPGISLKGVIPMACGAALIAAASFVWALSGGIDLLR